MNTGTYIFTLTLLYTSCVGGKQPHILFVLADDLGWNDVSYHGSEIRTPTIDMLANQGVTFENYYVQPICTPSRSQLLTGRYQIHTGLQHYVISGCQPMGLPLNETLLPELLRGVGYKTHAVGKWHLGFYKTDYFPTNRGFDTFYGYVNGDENYYTKIYSIDGYSGYDFYNNLAIELEANGTYSVDLYTRQVDKIIHNHDKNKPIFLYLPFQSVHEPNMAPERYINMYSFIKNKQRKLHAAMVTALDDGIAQVVKSFKSAGMWEDTVMIFSTDNGGVNMGGGNNWPLRGQKLTLYEGGVKGVGFALGKGINNPGTINKRFFHISDWFPTLLHIAGANKPEVPLDSYNVWESVSNNIVSPRTELLHNIDPIFESIIELKPYPNKHKFDTRKGHAAIRVGKWKLITGYPGIGTWFPRPPHEFNETYGVLPSPTKSVRLFDIDADPEERAEVSEYFPHIVDDLLRRLSEFNATAVPVIFPECDKKSDPKLYGGFWVPWE